jgi:serine protease AprX
MIRLFTVISLLLCGLAAFNPVQSATPRKHFIYFKDKVNTPFSVSQPQAYLSQAAIARRTRQQITVKTRDLPVTPAYITSLKNAGATVLYKSKWFNGALVFCDSLVLSQIQALTFVKRVETTNRVAPAVKPGKVKFEDKPVNNQRTNANRTDYGISFKQADMIGATKMHDAGFHGEGKTIAVFDAGFPGVNTALPFAHLYQNNQIKGVFDFVDKDNNVYEKSNHGTQTLSCIGAYQKGKYIGTAYKSDFYLFITENDLTEHPVEEYNWLIAAEYADSVGVDIISSSLGYTTFDYPSPSYSYADMNGKTAISTKAADFAAATGILVVNSAGNEGQSGWHYIGAPADGDSVLAIGAVDSLGFKAGFSSFGPASDGRIKPNLASMGLLPAVVLPSGTVSRNNGTSFSCPILAGMAAGFWQANPNLTNMQIISMLQQSANQASNPDGDLGYGIPNFVKAHKILNPNFPTDTTDPKDVNPGKPVAFFTNPIKGNLISLTFRDNTKTSEVEVLIFNRLGIKVDHQVVAKTGDGEKVDIVLPSGIAAGTYYMQVSWENNIKTLPFVKMH